MNPRLKIKFLLIVCSCSFFQQPAFSQDSQSPIDITSDSLIQESLPALHFFYWSRRPIDHVAHEVHEGDDGRHIPEIVAHVRPFRGLLSVDDQWYQLVSFHWHTAAEHRVDGVQPPMELHLVHRHIITNNLLVVGVTYEVGPRNAALNRIFKKLPRLSSKGDSVNVRRFNLNKLLPSTLTSYRYEGSLTTQPFTEGVKWVVLTEPMTASAAQMARLFDVTGDNARDVQPLNGRYVLTDLDDDDDD